MDIRFQALNSCVSTLPKMIVIQTLFADYFPLIELLHIELLEKKNSKNAFMVGTLISMSHVSFNDPYIM